jgi:hypothetical protein
MGKKYSNTEVDEVYLEDLKNFSKKNDQSIYVLSSENGSGKTTLIEKFLDTKKYSRHITLSLSNINVENEGNLVNTILAHFYSQLVLKSKLKVCSLPKNLSALEILIRIIIFVILSIGICKMMNVIPIYYFIKYSFEIKTLIFLVSLFIAFSLVMLVLNIIYQQFRFWKIERFNIKFLGIEMKANDISLVSEELLLAQKISSEMKKYDYIIIEDIDRIFEKKENINHIYSTLNEIIKIVSTHKKKTKFIFLIGTSNLSSCEEDILKYFGVIHFYKQKMGPVYFTNEILEHISNIQFRPDFTFIYDFTEHIRDLRELNTFLANFDLQVKILKPNSTEMVKKIMILEMIKMKFKNHYEYLICYINKTHNSDKEFLELKQILNNYRMNLTENDLLLYFNRGFSINDDKYIAGENEYFLELTDTSTLSDWILNDDISKMSSHFKRRLNQSIMQSQEGKYTDYLNQISDIDYRDFEYLFNIYNNQVSNPDPRFDRDVYLKLINLFFRKAEREKILDIKLYKLFYDFMTKVNDSELVKLDFINTYDFGSIKIPEINHIQAVTLVEYPHNYDNNYSDEFGDQHLELVSEEAKLLEYDDEEGWNAWNIVFEYLVKYFYFMSRDDLRLLKTAYAEEILDKCIHWRARQYGDELAAKIINNSQSINHLSKKYDIANIEKNYHDNHLFKVFIETNLITDITKKEILSAIGLKISLSSINSLEEYPILKLLIEKEIIFTDDPLGDANRTKARTLIKEKNDIKG